MYVESIAMKRRAAMYLLLATSALSCTTSDSTTTPSIPVALILVTPSARDLRIEETEQLDVLLRDAEGNELTGRSVRWSTTSSAIATVSGRGEVVGIAPGNAVIIATSEGVSGVATIGVRGPVTAVDVSAQASTALFTGQMLQLAARPRDVTGTVVSRAINWSSSAPAVATVSELGIVTAVAEGIAQIRAVSEGVTGQITVVVSPLDGSVAKVNVQTAIQVVGVGSTHLATAELRDAADNILVGRDVAWAMTNPSIASITPAGLITVLAPGSVTIRATSESRLGTRQLFGMPILFSGVPVMFTSQSGDQAFIGVNVPTGARRLTVTLRGGAGDPGLYVHEPLPGLDLPGELCGSQTENSPIETCIIQNPVAGLWLVEVYAWTSFRDVELRADVITASGATSSGATSSAATSSTGMGGASSAVSAADKERSARAPTLQQIPAAYTRRLLRGMRK
jgi:uncharacterized protein YjdB